MFDTCSFWKKVADIRLSEIKCISWLLQVRGLIYSTSSVSLCQVPRNPHAILHANINSTHFQSLLIGIIVAACVR